MMDAKVFGDFLAHCRKEKAMTQAELARKLHVTDKAVSRWERGIGFPDINTLEPLAEALGVSVLELMRSEKIAAEKVSREEVGSVVSDTLNMANWQRRQERKTIGIRLSVVFVLSVILLYWDRLQWRWETIIFESLGVLLPLFCLGGAMLLGVNGLWRKASGRACGQTLGIALALVAVLVLMIGSLLLVGVLGIGPIPN